MSRENTTYKGLTTKFSFLLMGKGRSDPRGIQKTPTTDTVTFRGKIFEDYRISYQRRSTMEILIPFLVETLEMFVL